MKIVKDNRRTAWTPPARPEWVSRINEEGSYMDLPGVVPLDEDSLIRVAQGNTGLSDFGADDWREPFRILLKALEEEAQLTLMGRLMARSDLLLYLDARLRIEDAYKRHPEIADQEITQPILIIGQGRGGTSALQNMLSKDPDTATLMIWEAMFPVPLTRSSADSKDPRIAKADKLISQWTRVVPELEAMHEFRAEVPQETVHLHALTFRSKPWFSLLGQVPSYNQYILRTGMEISLRYEKRVLQLQQWLNPHRKRWLLKSPEATAYMPDVLKVYPDMKFVWMHRDPVRSMSSLINWMGVLDWMRSDQPFKYVTNEQFTNVNVVAETLMRAIEWMESGVVPKQQVVNIHYQAFMDDPLAVAETIYAHVGWAMTDRGHNAMSSYMRNEPRERRPKNIYKGAERDQLDAERRLFQRYYEYFNVPVEAAEST